MEAGAQTVQTVEMVVTRGRIRTLEAMVSLDPAAEAGAPAALLQAEQFCLKQII